MVYYAFRHNWIVSNHNWWANNLPETVQFYPVSFHSRQVVYCLAYIYNAVAQQGVDTSQKKAHRSGLGCFCYEVFPTLGGV